MSRPRSLDVTADLTLDLGGHPVRIEGRSGVLKVEMPDVRAWRSLLAAPVPPGGRRAWLAETDRALRHAGLTLDVHVRGTRVGRLGTQARPGALSRLLRLGQAEVRPAQMLASALRRRPGLTLALLTGAAALLAALVYAARRT